MRILTTFIFLFFTTSSYAVTFSGKFIQGSFILGQTEPSAEVFIDKKLARINTTNEKIINQIQILFNSETANLQDDDINKIKNFMLYVIFSHITLKLKLLSKILVKRN